MDAESFGFSVEWFDAQADLMREYQLTVFKPQRGPLEASMYDPKSHRSFLKRMAIPELRLEDLHVGNTVTIHARHLKVKSYLDAHTRNSLEAKRAELGILVQPTAFNQLGQVISTIESSGLTMSRFRLVNASGPVVAIQVIGDEAHFKLDKVLQSIPASFVKQVSLEELNSYFEDKERYPTTAAFDHCTLLIIRPHALKAGNAGAIIAAIQAFGLEISAAQMLHMQRAEAAELLDVYKGVVPYHKEMVDGMSIAPCLAMELRAQDGVVERVRDLCGPYDVDMARHLRPDSLRARFGTDNANNGVHATDLEDDAELEVRYVFEMLASA
jgi:nucleoside-diphosphate kinase